MEVGLDGALQGHLVHVRCLLFVASLPADLVDDVARMAASQFLVERGADETDEVLGYAVVVGYVFVDGDAADDLGKLFLGDGAQLELGLDAAQEGGIDEAGGVVV